ncbi:MAG: hypothetical protein SPJ19_02855 [Candidatus Borkfalkiaceae bacterium]|nr:hypothetical protein [Christensenellaceae bacterium]
MKNGITENQKDKITSAIVKRALGYLETETVEEYSLGEEGEVRLSKRKITKKNVPPDLSAIKLLLGESVSVTELSDEELQAEKERLLNIIAEKYNNRKEVKKCRTKSTQQKTTKKDSSKKSLRKLRRISRKEEPQDCR